MKLIANVQNVFKSNKVKNKIIDCDIQNMTFSRYDHGNIINLLVCKLNF